MSDQRLLPLTVLLGVAGDMTVMQEEMFGPALGPPLPIKTYTDLDTVIE